MDLTRMPMLLEEETVFFSLLSFYDIQYRAESKNVVSIFFKTLPICYTQTIMINNETILLLQDSTCLFTSSLYQPRKEEAFMKFLKLKLDFYYIKFTY